LFAFTIALGEKQPHYVKATGHFQRKELTHEKADKKREFEAFITYDAHHEKNLIPDGVKGQEVKGESRWQRTKFKGNEECAMLD
jgi:hypothetical protein